MTDEGAGHTPADIRPGDAHALALSALAGLEPGVRTFLLQTCVLAVLEPATCDQLLARTGGQAVLDVLERRGLVVRESGGETRRYHVPMLVHEALASELAERIGSVAIRVRYVRAGSIMEGAGDWWGAAWAFARAEDAEALGRLARRRPTSAGGLAEPLEAQVDAHSRRHPALRGVRHAGATATAAAPAIGVRLLGAFEVGDDRGPVDLSALRPRVRALLQYLALHADTFVHRDVLGAVLWPEADVDTGRRGVQVAVSALRSVLQPGQPRKSTLLPRRGDAYALALAAHGSSDLLELDAQLARARRARAGGDVATAVAAWREVARLYRSDLLPEQGNAEWVVAERDRMRMAVADALESLGRSLVGTDAAAGAIVALRRALDLDPFRDGTWRMLAETHEALGDVSAAAAARQRHRRMLIDLGVVDETIDLRPRTRNVSGIPRPR